MSSPSIDFDALAKKHGAKMDYDALASKYGAQPISESPTQPKPYQPLDPAKAAIDAIAAGATKEATRHILNIGGMIRSLPLIGPAIEAISPDPLEDISRTVRRTVTVRDPYSGQILETDLETAKRMGMEPVSSRPTQKQPEPYSMFSREGQEAIGLTPRGPGETAGALGLNVAEYFVPGSKVAQGARFIKSIPGVPKLGQAGAFAAEAIPEMASAAAVTRIQQPQEPLTAPVLLAAASPLYGRALNWSGSKLPTAIAEKIPEVQLSPRQMLYKALKPINRNLEFEHALGRAVPEIYEQARLMNRTIESLDDLIAVTKAAKKRIWQPYADFLGETKATINGDEIADAMIRAIPERIRLKSPGAVKEIEDFAQRAYRGRRLSLQDAEDFLQNANADTQAYYAQFPRARYTTAEASPTVASTLAESETLRKLIYAKLDEISEISGAYGGKTLDARKVKQTYGALLNIEGEAYRRVNVAKRLAPESLTEQLGGVMAAGRFAWGMTKSVTTASPGAALDASAALAEAMATRAAAKWIKERNTSDHLIKRAFKDFGKEMEKWRKGQRAFIAAPAALETITSGKP